MKKRTLRMTRTPSEGLIETIRDAGPAPRTAPLLLPHSLIGGLVNDTDQGDQHLIDKDDSLNDIEAPPPTHRMPASGVASLPASLAPPTSDDVSSGIHHPSTEPVELPTSPPKQHPSLARQTTYELAGGSLQPPPSPSLSPRSKPSVHDSLRGVTSGDAKSAFSPKRPPMSDSFSQLALPLSLTKTLSEGRRKEGTSFLNDNLEIVKDNVATQQRRPNETPSHYQQQHDDDDDDSIDCSSDGIIAVGVPARPVTPDDDTVREEEKREERLRTQPVDMLEDANQAAVSNVIARNFAEMEFNKAEKGSKEEDDEAMIIDVVRRRSSRMSLTRRSPLAMAALFDQMSSGEQGYSSSTTGTSQTSGRTRIASPNKSSSRPDRSSPSNDVARLQGASTDDVAHEGLSSVFGLRPTAGFIEESGLESVSDIEEDEVSRDDSDDLEAGAGIPVAFPGAFAMIGMDATPGRQMSGYDSGVDDGDDTSESNDEQQITSSERPRDALQEDDDQETIAIEESELAPSSMPRGTSARLARNQVVVEGELITADDDSDDSAARNKRIRWRQGFVVLVLVAAAAVTAAVIVVVSNDGNGGSSQSAGPLLMGWKLVGGKPIFGLTDDDEIKFGKALTLSNNGNRLIVGQPGVDLGISERAVGRVNIYDWNKNQSVWELTTSFDGSSRAARAGSAVSANDYGTRVAVGEPNAFDDRGLVLIHEEDPETGEWTTIGAAPLFLGDTTSKSQFGSEVAMSSDGTTFACSAPYAALSASTRPGLVRAYEQQGDGSNNNMNGTESGPWSQKGDDIVGSEDNESVGWSVAISADGNILAVGAIGKDSSTGSVRVFAWSGEAWELVGQLGGVEEQDRFGYSVDLSADGNILAVGAPNREEVGEARVWQRMEDDRWKLLGQPIRGTSLRGRLGSSVALDTSGLILAVGSPDHSSGSDDNARDRKGKVQVFSYDDTEDDWVQREDDLVGSSDQDGLGSAVALSADGNRVAAGAPRAAFDGVFNEVGRVEVYDTVTLDEQMG